MATEDFGSYAAGERINLLGGASRVRPDGMLPREESDIELPGAGDPPVDGWIDGVVGHAGR